MDPDHPVPCVGDSLLLLGLPEDAIAELVMTAGEHSGSPLLLVDLRQLGGALSREPEGAGALGKIDAAFALTAIGMAITDEMASAADIHMALLTDSLQPWGADRPYMNFLERQGSTDTCFAPETYRQLQKVKATYP